MRPTVVHLRGLLAAMALCAVTYDASGHHESPPPAEHTFSIVITDCAPETPAIAASAPTPEELAELVLPDEEMTVVDRRSRTAVAVNDLGDEVSFTLQMTRRADRWRLESLTRCPPTGEPTDTTLGSPWTKH